MGTTVAGLTKVLETKPLSNGRSASIALHSTGDAMFSQVTSGEPPHAPFQTPQQHQHRTPVAAPLSALSHVRLRHPVYDRSGAVIRLSAKPTHKPETVYDRANLFLGYICQDERWAGRCVLARVLRELYRDFSRKMDPISWRSVAMEVREILPYAVVNKHVHEGGRDRRLQAYEIPDLR